MDPFECSFFSFQAGDLNSLSWFRWFQFIFVTLGSTSLCHHRCIETFICNLSFQIISEEEADASGSSTRSENVAIPHQSGSGIGLNNIAIDEIASIVAEKLKPSTTQLPDYRSLVPTFPIFDRPEATVATGQDDSNHPPVNYDHTIVKTDLNDKLDEKKCFIVLLKNTGLMQ